MPVMKSSDKTMRSDFYYESQCGGSLHGCRWTPEGSPRAVVQIIHGIAEYVERYDAFASYLSDLGYLVVAEDHMGHGKSISEKVPKACFRGGWDGAVADTYRLLVDTRTEFPEVPYVLFGHSMGSFMARTILEKYPDSGIAGAVICGTGWQPDAILKAGQMACKVVSKLKGADYPSKLLHAMAFGSYNKRVEHPRTASDWLSRDQAIVDAYVADHLCGFVASAGLMGAMMEGIGYIQNGDHLDRMKKDLPVYFIAGGDDPVGPYGDGVIHTADVFRKTGMEQVDVKIYPLCRHEILNEINRKEVFEDVAQWMEKVLSKQKRYEILDI